jgi:hypothetical protein
MNNMSSPKVRSFPLNKFKHNKEIIEYDRLHSSILVNCKKLIGNFSLTLCLRGRYLNTSKPTVLIVYDTFQSVCFSPNTGSLPVEFVLSPVVDKKFF